jgi:hypothetical protein
VKGRTASAAAAIFGGLGISAAFFSAIIGYNISDVVTRESNTKIAEANARQSEAELKLAQLRKLAGPRSINFDVLKKELEGKPKAPVVIWYVPESSDGFWFASRLFTALGIAGWQAFWPDIIPELKREDVEKVMPNSERLLQLLHGQPRAMTAGGQPSGVTVVADDITTTEPNASMSPYKALFEALSKSTDFGMYGSGGSQFMPAPKTDPIFMDNPPNAATTPK